MSPYFIHLIPTPLSPILVENMARTKCSAKKSTGRVVNHINGGPAPKSTLPVPTCVNVNSTVLGVDSAIPLVPARINAIASGTSVSTAPTQVTVKNFTQKFGRELEDEVCL